MVARSEQYLGTGRSQAERANSPEQKLLREILTEFMSYFRD